MRFKCWNVTSDTVVIIHEIKIVKIDVCGVRASERASKRVQRKRGLHESEKVYRENHGNHKTNHSQSE